MPCDHRPGSDCVYMAPGIILRLLEVIFETRCVRSHHHVHRYRNRLPFPEETTPPDQRSGGEGEDFE